MNHGKKEERNQVSGGLFREKTGDYNQGKKIPFCKKRLSENSLRIFEFTMKAKTHENNKARP